MLRVARFESFGRLKDYIQSLRRQVDPCALHPGDYPFPHFANIVHTIQADMIIWHDGDEQCITAITKRLPFGLLMEAIEMRFAHSQQVMSPDVGNRLAELYADATRAMPLHGGSVN